MDTSMARRGGSVAAPARAPQGERKFVTALFADVVGSTAMAEELDPEDIAEIMNGAFGSFNPVIAKYGGTVARLLGDALLALFGVPVAHEDDAERAILAGLEIQEAAQDYACGIKASYGVDFGVRVGINSGLAVVDLVGDRLRAEYTALGDTVNTAARMQSAAEPGTVLITADTFHLVKDLFDVESRGALDVKGKAAPVEAYEVTAARPTRGKAGRGLQGLASPLVGRDAELRHLRARLEDLHGGRGAFVAVIGEAGLGKSRLLAELRQSLPTGPGPDLRVASAEFQVAGASLPSTEPEPRNRNLEMPLWLEGRALSYGQTITYFPWRQVLRQAIEARENDAPEEVREQLGAACARLGLPADDAALLEVLLGVESAAATQAIAGLDSEELAQQIAAATRDFLGGLARAAPVVVVFDDLHWADAASLDLLQAASGAVAELPLLLVAIMRPDKGEPGRPAASWTMVERVRSALGERFTEITLEPLSAGDSRHLLGNLLHIEDLPESVRTLILTKSEGNPFFLEEVIRSLIDSGHIVQEDGHWQATRDIVDVAIPDTLAGVLSARIDRLPEERKRVAQTAAVIGRIFGERVLATVSEEAPLAERVEDHLKKLTYGELVRERPQAVDDQRDLEYIFKHALTQEAAYDLLLLRRRREYHRLVGQAMEKLYPERLDDMAAMLAHHFREGQDWAHAAEYATRAGARAVRVHALREALDHYQRAGEALDKLPGAPPERVVDAILEWTTIAYQLRLFDQVLERLPRAEQIARQLGDKSRLAQALMWQASTHVVSGFPSRGVEAMIEGQELASELGDELLTMLPQFMMSTSLIDHDPRDALVQLDAVIDMARRHKNREIESHALASKAMALARLGEFGPARETIDQALAVLPHAHSPVKEADVHSTVGLAYFDMGDVERGIEHSRLGAERAASVNAVECTIYGHLATGMGNLQKPDLRDAAAAFEQAMQVAEVTPPNLRAMISEGLTSHVRAGLAIAQFFDGRDEALAEIEAALATARGLGDEYFAAYLAHTLGEAYTRQRDFQRAEEHFQRALKYYDRTQLRPYRVRTLEALAAMYDRAGRSADAERTRAEAQEVKRDLARGA